MKKAWRGISSAISLSVIMSVSFPAGVLLAPAGFASAAISTTAVTVDGGSSTVVVVGDTVSVTVNTTTSNSDNWSATAWRVSTSPSSGGTNGCDTGAFFNTNGSHSDTFSVTVPSTPGTYNLYATAYHANSCSSGGTIGNTLSMVGVITVVSSSRTTNSATLNGLSSVTVAPGASITAAVTGTIANNSADWHSTGWRISTTAPGTVSCANSSPTGTDDRDSQGTYTNSYTITAPVTPGTYNAYFRISGSNSDCTTQTGTLLTMTNAIVVANPDSVAPQVSTSHIQSSNTTTNLAKVGDTVTVTFTASEAVRTPVLSIAGHSVAVATTSGNSFAATYVMQSTDSTGNVGIILSLTDLAGNAMASPATVTTDSSTVTFDKTAPTLTDVTSTQADGSYGASTVTPVSVTFSENVSVSGTPTLVLNSGGSATYQSGSGTSALTFSYTVVGGENSSDLSVTASSIAASVTDAAGNLASGVIPSGHNLGDNKAIVIDTVAPTVALSTMVSTPTNASPFVVTVTFSEPVSGFDLTDVTISGVDGTTLGNLQTSDNTVFTFDTTPGAEGHVLLTVHAAAASDAASNLNSAQSNTLDITYDTTVPSLSITSGPVNPINTDEDVASFVFTTDATTVNCSIDGLATTTSCTSPFTVGGSPSALSAGSHTFYVEAQDEALNTALASYAFVVDLAAPTIDAMSDINVVATSPSGATVTYSVPAAHDDVDASLSVTCDVATSTTLAIGDRTVTCTAHDLAGNDATPVVFHIIVSDLAAGQFVGIDATQPAAASDGTYANGWHWTLTFKLPFDETQFTMKWSDFSNGSDTITADNIRFCSEQSDMNCSDDGHYVSITASSTDSAIIVFSGDADNDADGRQVEVQVQVRVPVGSAPGTYTATYEANSDTAAPPMMF